MRLTADRDGPLARAMPRGAPVRGGRGPGLERAGDDPLHVGVRDGPGRARAGLVDEPVEAAGDEPVPPRADGRGAEAKPPGHDAVVRLVGAGQHEAGALGEPLGALGPAGEGQEFLSLVVGQDEGGLWARHARTIPTASPEREQIKRTSDSGH
jgi:hypothetical protein